VFAVLAGLVDVVDAWALIKPGDVAAASCQVCGVHQGRGGGWVGLLTCVGARRHGDMVAIIYGGV